MGAAVSFIATAKSRPLGEGGIAAFCESAALRGALAPPRGPTSPGRGKMSPQVTKRGICRAATEGFLMEKRKKR